MRFTRSFVTGAQYPPAPRRMGESSGWPAHWVSLPDLPPAPYAVAYRNTFRCPAPQSVRAHVTADERYELFLDGERVAMGPERGDVNHWFYETYDFELTAGEHTLVALVVSIGPWRPHAQMTLRHGWMFSPQNPEHVALLGTGVAAWEARVVTGLAWTEALAAWGTGLNLEFRGEAYPWGIESGLGSGWAPAVVTANGAAACFDDGTDSHSLLPATLPPMLDERRHTGRVRLVAALPVSETDQLETHAIPIRAADHLANESADWQRLMRGEGTLEIPAFTRRRVLVDLEEYYCARPQFTARGGCGATVRVHWQEALYANLDGREKGNRDEVEGKYFKVARMPRDGIGDIFIWQAAAIRALTPPSGGSADAMWRSAWKPVRTA